MPEEGVQWNPMENLGGPQAGYQQQSSIQKVLFKIRQTSQKRLFPQKYLQSDGGNPENVKLRDTEISQHALFQRKF